MIHLSVDLGTKRIGLAISDADARMAFPLDILGAQALADDAKAVHARAVQERAKRIVVGFVGPGVAGIHGPPPFRR